jgi:hypothetical protein
MTIKLSSKNAAAAFLIRGEPAARLLLLAGVDRIREHLLAALALTFLLFSEVFLEVEQRANCRRFLWTKFIADR